jgi:nitrite reductase/ring-hydroxylating ferredoxin subunit
MTHEIDTARVICAFAALDDPGSRAFTLGSGDWPLRGFVVRRGAQVFGYVNRCPHQQHPLNWRPDQFLAPDGSVILCSSHGAIFDIASGTCIAGPCPGRGLQRLPLRLEAGLVILGDGVPLEEEVEQRA